LITWLTGALRPARRSWMPAVSRWPPDRLLLVRPAANRRVCAARAGGPARRDRRPCPLQRDFAPSWCGRAGSGLRAGSLIRFPHAGSRACRTAGRKLAGVRTLTWVSPSGRRWKSVTWSCPPGPTGWTRHPPPAAGRPGAPVPAGTRRRPGPRRRVRGAGIPRSHYR
jgi:hypothetical protein